MYVCTHDQGNFDFVYDYAEIRRHIEKHGWGNPKVLADFRFLVRFYLVLGRNVAIFPPPSAAV